MCCACGARPSNGASRHLSSNRPRPGTGPSSPAVGAVRRLPGGAQGGILSAQVSTALVHHQPSDQMPSELPLCSLVANVGATRWAVCLPGRLWGGCFAPGGVVSCCNNGFLTPVVTTRKLSAVSWTPKGGV